jgi:mono/diheme cytochrome c family protein
MTSRKKSRFLAGLCTAAVLWAWNPAKAADTANGERLALRWCAACHVVAPHQQGTTGEAPPFATIARRSEVTAPRLAQFLLDPHPKMPNLGLTRAEAADLAAYITSLRN